MTLDELTTSIRYHYKHRMNGITGFITGVQRPPIPGGNRAKDGQPPTPQDFPFPKSRSGTGNILTLMYMTAA